MAVGAEKSRQDGQKICLSPPMKVYSEVIVNVLRLIWWWWFRISKRKVRIVFDPTCSALAYEYPYSGVSDPHGVFKNQACRFLQRSLTYVKSTRGHSPFRFIQILWYVYSAHAGQLLIVNLMLCRGFLTTVFFNLVLIYFKILHKNWRAIDDLVWFKTIRLGYERYISIAT